MSWFEPLIIAGVVAFVVTVFSIHIYRKKKGKSSCSCGCQCGSAKCTACAMMKETETNKK